MVRKGVFVAAALVAMSLPAFAQSPEQRQAMEGEYRTFFLAHRALSTCPNLIEDWEYELVGSRLSMLERQLTRGSRFHPEVKRQLIGQVEALGCEDPAVIQEAARFRNYAHTYWRLAADAWQNAGGCAPPNTEQHDFFEAMRAKVDQAHSGEDGLPPLDMAWLEAVLPNYAVHLGAECADNEGKPRFDTDADRLQQNALDPFHDYWTLASANYSRSRYFDYNQGFTLGVGETFDGDWQRNSYVEAIRAPKRADRTVWMRNVACGGGSKSPVSYSYLDVLTGKVTTSAFNDRIKCSVGIEHDGTAWIDVNWETINKSQAGLDVVTVRLDAVELQLLAPDGSLMSSLSGDVQFQSTLGATATVHGAMLPILAAANSTQQVHFKLTFEIIANGTRQKVSDIVEGLGNSGIRTVAALDVIRAARFAFGDQSDDLIWNGLVVQAAGQAGLGDSLTLTYEQ